MLVEGVEKITIVSPFGWRTRAGNNEFHQGVDIRVVDEKWRTLRILAPEKLKITAINMDPMWGHWIKAVPLEANELGIDEFRFWHQVPLINCVEGAIFFQDDPMCIPEAGFVALHLHFATLKNIGEFVDPMPYLKLRELV